MVKITRKKIYLSPPNLAPLRLSGRNGRFREFLVPEDLREPRKLSAIVIQGSHRKKIRIRKLAAKGAKKSRGSSGGFKAARWDWAHRKMCVARASILGPGHPEFGYS